MSEITVGMSETGQFDDFDVQIQSDELMNELDELFSSSVEDEDEDYDIEQETVGYECDQELNFDEPSFENWYSEDLY